MEKNVVVGLMSGTSLDGLDLVCAEFIHEHDRWKFNILASQNRSYDRDLLQKVKQAISSRGEKSEDLHKEYGRWLGKCTKEFIQSLSFSVDLIASHGQTIFHDPSSRITIQVGDGQEIANLCGIPVISNFREADVLMGGQGAPLVPIGDLLLFPDFTYCLNLGGIANISHKVGADIRAFDVCICNAGANYFAGLNELDYDDKGRLAIGGNVNMDLLKLWNDLAYFKQEPPKSMDASFFHSKMLPFVGGSKDDVSNYLRTLYQHIAMQISNTIDNKNDGVLITGGGAYNDLLMDLLRQDFDLNIIVPKDELIEFKEALIFAFMGHLKWNGQNNVLASVTGSPKSHSSGVVSLPA